MSIDFNCDGCGHSYRVTDEKAGLKLRCKACGSVTTIPARNSGADDEVVVYARAELADETPFPPTPRRPLSSPGSGRLKSGIKKKKKSPNPAVAIGAGAAAVLVVAAGAFLGIRAFRSEGEKPVEVEAVSETMSGRTAANGVSGSTPPRAENPATPGPAPVSVALVPRDSAGAAVPSERLKQIGAAMRTFCQTNGAFPQAASYDAEGRALLSWRVHLLPYLGEKKLYSQFKLDEPWDSVNNLPLVARMPEIYLSPGSPNDGKTRIMVLSGRGTLFESEGRIKPSDVHDGLSITVLAVETTPLKRVEWTRPQDVQLKGLETRLELGLNLGNEDDFQALMADGNVVVLSRTIPPQTLQGIATRAGNDGAPMLLRYLVAGDPPSALSEQVAK